MNRGIKFYFNLLIILLTSISHDSLAQKSISPGYLTDQYWVEHFDKMNGMPENVVMDINQEKHGIIWITTPYHLVQYDGCDFVSYKPADQFTGEYFHFFPGLEIDPAGTIWSPAKGAGVLSFDVQSKKFTKYDYLDSESQKNLSNIPPSELCQSENGDIWTTTHLGITRFHRNKGKYEIVSYPSKKIKLMDSIFNILDGMPALGGITKVKDYANITRLIEIQQPNEFLIVYMGEAGLNNGTCVDCGELVDASGKIIWTPQGKKSVHAGGAFKNIYAIEKLHLESGTYTLHYTSDDSHSFDRWNEAAPLNPEYWGIQIYKTNQTTSIISNIQNTINENIQNDPAQILKLIPTGTNEFLGISSNGLSKVEIPFSSEKKFTVMPLALRNDFLPDLKFDFLDKNTLFIPGRTVVDYKTGKTKASSLIYTISDGLAKIIDMDGVDLSGNPFLKDKKGNFWLGDRYTGTGMYVSNDGSEFPKYKKFQIRAADKVGVTYTLDEIWDLFEDKDGNIWVGSRQSCLYKIKPYKYSNQFIEVPSPNKSMYRDIIEDNQGNIWMSHSKVITKFDIRSKSLVHYPNTDTTLVAPDLFLDSGSLYYGGRIGLKKWDTIKAKFITERFDGDDSLFVAGKDDFGRMWYYHKHMDKIYLFSKNKYNKILFDSSKTNQLRYLHRSENGDIWYAPAFSGVHQYKIQNEREVFIKKHLPPNMDVHNIIDGYNHTVWIGTYNDGLIHLDISSGRYKAYTTQDGLPSNKIAKVQLLKNKLWVITDIGSGFLYFKDSTFKPIIKLDNYLKPLISNQDMGSAFYETGWHRKTIQLKNGLLACIVRDGFITFDPDQFDSDTLTPVLFIKNFTANQESIPHVQVEANSVITLNKLDYTQDDITIGFHGINFDRNNENRYAYFLKGANKEWIYSGTERIARFSNLRPGKYEFYLKASNADGFWSPEKKMLQFTISPPWWKTWWSYGLYFIGAFLGIRYYLNYKNQSLKDQNIRLESTVHDRTKELKESLQSLQSTQAQLIQSEKMASLGELTAGIAHEIQNPLNFVNNFSELNTELIDELQQELKAGKIDDAVAISNDLKENSEKINHHGKRAESIVKGMLEHSRKSSGVNEPTDINKLCDEFIRLSYHGLRAKDKDFNCDYKLDLDPTLPLVNVVSQDIGRVILNIVNNAFQVCAERLALSQTEVSRSASAEQSRSAGSLNLENQEDYKPLVVLTTKFSASQRLCEICISDNGPGIPPHIKDKIFQPFFTTKPTGQGTGLGLSLAYDIVKAHKGSIEVKSHYSPLGGEIKVEGKQVEGTSFIITIPIQIR